MATANQQTTTAAAADRRLATFILIGLGLAAVAALAFFFFHPTSQPPKLAAFPGAKVLTAGDNGGEFAADLEVSANLVQVSDFYSKEFSTKGWSKLNESVSTPDHVTSTYESQDQQWGATLDIDYNAATGIANIGIYERKLGD